MLVDSGLWRQVKDLLPVQIYKVPAPDDQAGSWDLRAPLPPAACCEFAEGGMISPFFT